MLDCSLSHELSYLLIAAVINRYCMNQTMIVMQYSMGFGEETIYQFIFSKIFLVVTCTLENTFLNVVQHNVIQFVMMNFHYSLLSSFSMLPRQRTVTFDYHTHC